MGLTEDQKTLMQKVQNILSSWKIKHFGEIYLQQETEEEKTPNCWLGNFLFCTFLVFDIKARITIRLRWKHVLDVLVSLARMGPISETAVQEPDWLNFVMLQQGAGASRLESFMGE